MHFALAIFLKPLDPVFCMCLCLSVFVALYNYCNSQLEPEHIWAQYRQILGKYTPRCTERNVGPGLGEGSLQFQIVVVVCETRVVFPGAGEQTLT